MKKTIIILLLLLLVISLTSCEKFSKPEVGNKVDSLQYKDYTIDYSWNVFELMDLISVDRYDYCYDYEVKMQVSDEEEFEVSGSYYEYTKPRDKGDGYVSGDNIYYRYATTTKNFAKFELYEVGSVYAPAANRYVGNGIALVAGTIYEDRTVKTLFGGPIQFPSLGDIESNPNFSNLKPYVDHYNACIKFPNIYYSHNPFIVSSKYIENYNYSYKLYENYIVFNFENPYGIGFERLSALPQEELFAMKQDAYYKAEIYLNIENNTIDYYYFDTISYASFIGIKVKCTATIARVDISAEEIQKKIDGVFTANETTIGFGEY